MQTFLNKNSRGKRNPCHFKTKVFSFLEMTCKSISAKVYKRYIFQQNGFLWPNLSSEILIYSLYAHKNPMNEAKTNQNGKS